jgi:hypothetical protein
MDGFASGALAVTMIAAALLIIFGVRSALQPDNRKRGVLMIVCGLVFVGNVLVWTL